MRVLLVLGLVLGLAARAEADPWRILVLPLPASESVDANAARLFDARLLVALDDTKRVVTITADEEPDCTSLACLAELGKTAGASHVLAMSIVREDDGLTVFGTLVDAKTGAATRRVELDRVSASHLAKTPSELVPQLVGAPSGGGGSILGVTPLPAGPARVAAQAVSDQLAAWRGFSIVPMDGTDRSTVTHRVDLAISDLRVDTNRRILCTYYDATLTGTLTITDLATGRPVFTKTVTTTATRRSHFSSHQEMTDLVLNKAVDDWIGAFRDARVAAVLAKRK